MTLKKAILSVTTAFLLVISALVNAIASTNTVFATSDTCIAYEARNVLDDLKGSVINGAEFAEEDYGPDAARNTQLLSFIEFCYAAAPAGAQSDFGLYVYVYNPRCLNYNTTSARNYITLRAGTSENYVKYPLTFLNASADKLFLKYKIYLTSTQRALMLAALQPEARKYEVSEFELDVNVVGAVAQSYSVGTVYTYTGYAAGYGPDAEPLNCSAAAGEVVSFDVKQTYYDNATSWNTAKRLNSVYFAVDNKYIKKYGSVYEIVAEYYRHTLAPIIVTNNSDCWADLWGHVYEGRPLSRLYLGTTGRNIAGYPVNWKWAAPGAWALTFFGEEYFETSDCQTYTYSWPVLPFTTSGSPRDAHITRAALTNLLEFLTLTMYADDARPFGYAEGLFDGPGEKTEITVTGKDLITLNGFDLGNGFANWVANLFTGVIDANPAINDIAPIVAIDARTSMHGNLSERFLIAAEDVDEFAEFCAGAVSEDKTVILFRYSTSDYKEEELHCAQSGVSTTFNTVTGQSIRFETVDLGFDVISLGFKTSDEKLTRIGVAASPINIIPGAPGMPGIINRPATPPWWVWLIIAGAVVLAVVVIVLILKNQKNKR